MIPIKSTFEISLLKKACKIVAKCFNHIQPHVKAGITTSALDLIIEDYILTNNAAPSFKGYNGYTHASCISVNDVVVHGIPNNYLLKDGDIVSVDIGAFINGFHGDAARTYAIGKISGQNQRLIDVTAQSFYEGIKFAKNGSKVGDIGYAVQTYVQSFGFSAVRALAGHGIGKKLHEEPSVPNYGLANTGAKLKTGNAIAVEPMINIGKYDVKIDSDGWTCRTIDGLNSAHYENTLLITDGEPDILTL